MTRYSIRILLLELFWPILAGDALHVVVYRLFNTYERKS
jgi:hypothetical protein